jgi:pilus assembly protein CpaB
MRVDGAPAIAEAAIDGEGDRRQGDRRQGERRQGERRGLEDLRSNVTWTVAADRRRSALGGRRLRLKPSQIAVLVVALGAGGVAAYLATHLTSPRAEVARVAEAAPQPATRILVASQEIAVGQRLSAASLAWQDWPDVAPNSDYVTQAATPTAIADMSGSVARSEFLPGDPIRKQKLARTAGSFLPALLDNGMRGVSLVVSAASASGGFIGANDRVDVVLTRPPAQNDSQGQGAGRRSETILHNVQILAIDSQLGPQRADPGAEPVRADTFTGDAIATLALDPADAELVISASAIGKLSLLLRSSVDVADKKGTRDGINQAIRISSPFWSK